MKKEKKYGDVLREAGKIILEDMENDTVLTGIDSQVSAINIMSGSTMPALEHSVRTDPVFHATVILARMTLQKYKKLLEFLGPHINRIGIEGLVSHIENHGKIK